MKYAFLFFTFFHCAFAQVDHLTHWNAKDYHFHSEEQFQVAKQVVENLPLQGNEAVLDIGCGDGKITAMIQARLQEGHVVGVDISPSMIAYAKDAFPQVKFAQKDAHFLNYDQEFDLIVSFTTMQWVTNQAVALRGVHKALKKGGRVIIEMPQGLPQPMKDAVEEVMVQPRWKRYFVNYAPNWRFYECAEYQSLMEKEGFKTESITSREISCQFPSKQAFIGFLQQWFPYLAQLPSDVEKRAFLEQVVERYLKATKSSDEVPFPVRRLNVVAKTNL